MQSKWFATRRKQQVKDYPVIQGAYILYMLWIGLKFVIGVNKYPKLFTAVEGGQVKHT